MDVEKTMEFILSVQARLEASVQKRDEEIADLRASLTELKSSVATVTDLVDSVEKLTDRDGHKK